MDTEELLNTILQDNEQTRRHLDEKAAEMGRHFDDKAAEMGRHFDDKAAEMGRHFDDSAAEMGRHFDVVAESLKSEIRVIAEGHGVLVQKMDRLETQVENFALETRTNFDEVRAAIKFSYAELDRRVSHLESTITSIDARVSRLESRP